MPTWWGKYSSKDVKKKKTKENSAETPHLLSPTEQKGIIRSVWSRRRRNVASEKGSISRAVSRSPSPTSHVGRCQSFAGRLYSQPLPLPVIKPLSIGRTPSATGDSVPMLEKRGKPPLTLPIPARERISNKLNSTDTDIDLTTASVSSNCSIDSNDLADSSPSGNVIENSTKVAAIGTSSIRHRDKIARLPQRTIRDSLKTNISGSNGQFPSTSPKRVVTNPHRSNIPNSWNGTLASAPGSSMSSPCRSPRRMIHHDQISNPAVFTGKPHAEFNAHCFGQCSSPSSGQTSGHNSTGGDLSGQLFWQQNKCSPECSPIPSPRMTSPGPSSRIQSGSVTPIHQWSGGTAPESPAGNTDDMKKQSHRLPLPPIKVSNVMFSSSNSTTINSPSIPRSPARAENPTSPVSHWKKGRMIGRGTFGHVYVGFNSECGEMCAMKEVTLFFDDAKSKESAKQLGQEISLLSRLRHQNIVQYYGSETIDDKLYIYLEYVSGGSIHKLLQEYGQFGEPAIRNYTRQILSGLAYLHAKNTVHRDIKGANILVDPNGRIKLADFGMAKHITGQSCPLSFKGSPYWMAPEVIKNMNGCNLAVDIWSLGCTVLEMATSKPPWSQYEGIAAMFKIGNSKELPPIPNHLSNECKDFIKLCLQREPSRRPTASDLLRHSFVSSIISLEKSVHNTELLESPGASVGTEIKSGRHARNQSSLDIDRLVIQRLNGAKSSIVSSDHHTKNMSCPISPMGSPLLRSRSPQQFNGRMSPSSISSPIATSGSSTPLTGGNGALPLNHSLQLAYVHEGYVNVKPPGNFHMNGNNGSTCLDIKHDLFRGSQPVSPIFRDIVPSETDSGNPHFGRSAVGDHKKINTSLNIIPESSSLRHVNESMYHPQTESFQIIVLACALHQLHRLLRLKPHISNLLFIAVLLCITALTVSIFLTVLWTKHDTNSNDLTA